jgi:hypothetical protein
LSLTTPYSSAAQGSSCTRKSHAELRAPAERTADPRRSATASLLPWLSSPKQQSPNRPARCCCHAGPEAVDDSAGRSGIGPNLSRFYKFGGARRGCGRGPRDCSSRPRAAPRLGRCCPASAYRRASRRCPRSSPQRAGCETRVDRTDVIVHGDSIVLRPQVGARVTGGGAARDCFAPADAAELTIELATQRSPSIVLARERSATMALAGAAATRRLASATSERPGRGCRRPHDNGSHDRGRGSRFSFAPTRAACIGWS